MCFQNGELDKVKYALDVSRTQEEKTRKSLQEIIDQKDMELGALRAQLDLKSGLQNPGSLSSLTDLLDEELSDGKIWSIVPLNIGKRNCGLQSRAGLRRAFD